MEARYDNSMKDGDMSAMEVGRVSLKAFSAASTLSSASKKGCEWVTNKSIDSSSTSRMIAKTMKEQKCFAASIKFLEKARVAGDDPEEAKVKAQKIMLSVDCKLPSEDSALPAQKSLQELARMEEAAEAGALSEIQEFKKGLTAGKQTSLVETKSGVGVVVSVIAFLMFWFGYALACTVALTVLATLLTTVFLVIKAAFKFALGLSSVVDFNAEIGSIMKPMFTILTTGCFAFSSLYWGSALSTLALNGGLVGGAHQ